MNRAVSALLRNRIAVVSLVALAMLAAGSAQAGSYKVGQKLVGGIVGVGLAGAYGSGGTPIGIEFDAAVNDKISAGGVLGFASSKEDFIGYGWKYTYTIFAVRGAYHFSEQIKDPKMDAYVGATLGYNNVSVSTTGNAAGFTASGSYALYGIHAGGRYDFSPKWGGQAELGYGIGYLSAGVYYRL
jgi:hypothetical protein